MDSSIQMIMVFGCLIFGSPLYLVLISGLIILAVVPFLGPVVALEHLEHAVDDAAGHAKSRNDEDDGDARADSARTAIVTVYRFPNCNKNKA